MGDTTKHILKLLSVIVVLCGVLAVIHFYPTVFEGQDGAVVPDDNSAGSNPPIEEPSDPELPNDVPSYPEPPINRPISPEPPLDEPIYPGEDEPISPEPPLDEPIYPGEDEPISPEPPIDEPPVVVPPEDTSPIVVMNGKYYTYTEMKDDLAKLAARYPDHLTYRSYGTSADGRNLYVATLGNPKAEKQVIITSGMHAREYVNCFVIMRQIEYYLENYNTLTYQGQPISQLFSEVCFVIAPMTNPDGITIAQEGLSALRTQAMCDLITDIARGMNVTGNTAIDAYLNKNWKSNARGVDINRNFDALWSEHNDGMYAPSYKNYKGAMAVSEPETAALVTLTESLSNPVASVCVHSQGQVIYWRCFQEGALWEQNRRLAEIAQSVTGYFIIDENQTEPSYSNWTILAHGIPTITIETGLSTYPLSYQTLADNIFNRNRDLWAALAYEYANQE